MAEEEMHAAPSVAVSIARLVAPPALLVMTILPYGADMSTTLRVAGDRSQSHFDADQLEAMTGCVELINTGRLAAGEGLAKLADLKDRGIITEAEFQQGKAKILA